MHAARHCEASNCIAIQAIAICVWLTACILHIPTLSDTYMWTLT